MIRVRSLFAAGALSASVALVLASGAAAQPLTRGIVDNDSWFATGTSGQQTWLSRTAAAGAKIVQIEVDWSTVESTAPSGGDPTSPGDPQYDFSYLDQRVEAAEATGLQPLLLVTNAPSWAEGSGGSAAEYATDGYEPNATAYGQLGQALAARYSGSYDGLPRVRYFQVWGEANIGAHLSPQWTQSGGTLVNTGATIYRSMLNSFYAGVKAGDRGDTVVLGGPAPYGDAPTLDSVGVSGSLPRTRPVTFLENLLCLNAQLRKTCSTVTRFDVLAADPYEGATSPTTHAYYGADVSTPDLGKLVKVENAALRAHTLAGSRKPLWVTEFGFDTTPQDPDAGWSPATQARYVEQSLQIFWSEGVTVALSHLIRDEPSITTWNWAEFLDYSGLYYNNGVAKPALTAYRFPFVATRSASHTQAWGIGPSTGTVQVQRQVGRSWKTIASFRVAAGAVYNRSLGKQPHGAYRATLGSQVSLTWST